jgi:hypothetical protein
MFSECVGIRPHASINEFLCRGRELEHLVFEVTSVQLCAVDEVCFCASDFERVVFVAFGC